jgi:SAM-dependent methyltransferase
MPPSQPLDWMREDWNRRAREDAHYYVAFGQRGQSDSDFFATGADVVRLLESELKRLDPSVPARARRALEIGCGPGRLLRPMSRRFGEIHGVDISDEMIRLAREKLQGIPHAHVHVAANCDLAAFASESFDFVYSYAVFQHIPSREVVFGYLEEARRVLKRGGVMKCQINGLPKTAKTYDTWSGVRVDPGEIREFARAGGLQLLSLEGIHTQYMWTTMRRPAPGAQSHAVPEGLPSIRRITNAFSSEPVVPASGRFACASLWVEGLPAACDLNRVSATIGGRPADLSYIGPEERDGIRQVNIPLPAGMPSGLHPIALAMDGKPLTGSATVRVIPAGPSVPRVISVTDGVDLISANRITSDCLKVVVEELDRPEALEATLGDALLPDGEVFCVDPVPPRFEINWPLPQSVPKGQHWIRLRYGKRELGPLPVEVA